MILLLATRYRKISAWLLLLVADLSFAMTADASMGHTREVVDSAQPLSLWSSPDRLASLLDFRFVAADAEPATGKEPSIGRVVSDDSAVRMMSTPTREASKEPDRRPAIGGPNQPEMTSFKSVNVNNMVNLFTGGFSYNIPLLDVGGYPVNLYYNAEVGTEQDASWVGLGWNINPGDITRNMRGIPDDFNGQETLTDTQAVKPNVTYGVSAGPDFEFAGIKTLGLNLGLSLGVSLNNYLGAALDLGVKGGVNFKVANKVLSEKGSLSLGASIGADLSSRSGLTLSPSVSLTASMFANDRTFTFGPSLSTSYNSRVGVKALQLSEQVSANRMRSESTLDDQNNVTTYTQSSTVDATVHSTAITFARPSYSPTIRMPMLNSAYSGHFQLGSGLFGGYASGEVEVYKQTSTIDPTKQVQNKQMVGYLYYEKATTNPNAVTDFARFNDREVTPNTPIISAPQYTYDIFTIQGEGTGGSIRAYRGDLGFVRDNNTGSEDGETGIGLDFGPPGHFGGNLNLVKTPTTVGEWSAGNKLHQTIPFNAPTTNGSVENILFRNPGEVSVLDNHAFTRIGGTDLVRFELSGDPHNPTIEPKLDRFSTGGVYTSTVYADTTSPAPTRQKRDQVVDFFTAADAQLIGLDKTIRSYNSVTILDPTADTLLYTTIPRTGGSRLGNHISQINVTESNGKRYIYGLPVYNTVQKDFTFTVGNSNLSTPDQSDTVNYTAAEPTPGNTALAGTTGSRDGYLEVAVTPGYAHSFLLTGLLSPDYVDVTGDGITDDDLGQAVKFNYTEMVDGSGNPLLHNWRTPSGQYVANFNPGTRSQSKDDKGLISFGQRESWYLHSIESKTMIAIFILENRADGKGVIDQNGGINLTDASSKALQEIRLYSKSDLRQHGLSGAKPIKTVHFVYDYTLCPGTRDNTNSGGKLTLDSVYFTFNGQDIRRYQDKYVFSYVDSSQYGSNGPAVNYGNPAYATNASDRWGTYKPASMNPGGVKNSDFPYTIQEQAGQTQSPKPQLDANAGAWSLKRILLPSGGQIEVGYEGDDYAYVQNVRATDMLSVAGFGSTPTAYSNRLFDISWSGGILENVYLFVNVPSPCTTANDVLVQYLQGINQIAVKLDVNMPAGTERVTSYATIDSYGVYSSNVIWIKLTEVNGVAPLSLSAVEYLKDQLPAEAYPGYDVSQSSGLQEVAGALIGMLDNLKSAFSDPVTYLRSQGMAQTVVIGQCFARLNDPDGIKYGGGQRVKWITLKDNWQAMTGGGQFTSMYTQTYDYTTTEIFNGNPRVISSGVASYEPGIGGDENPFQTSVQVQNKLPLGPVSYGAIEMPVLEPFFPSPLVGYSQVTVRSLSSAPPQTGQKSRSGIGRQVTQFYTAKDYPVYYSNTGLDPSTDLEAHDASTTNFFYKYAFDSRALSQGFLVAVNDMHGKMKSQTSYADNDTTLIVNYTQNFYRNTGVNGLNETFNFVSSAQGGLITPGNLGIDIELMTDTREFTVASSSLEVQGQVDLFPVFFPVWLPFIWPVSGNSENNYRAVTTTKYISYKAVLDSVAVYDKGSMVSTKNLLYDAQTGQVVVTRTNNEFNQPVYSTTYPAWWAYDGMGPAYENTEVRYSSMATPLNFTNGLLVGSTFNAALLVSGDELFITTSGQTSPGCPAASPPVTKLWVLDVNKNNPPFPLSTPSFIFIDSAGNPYTNTSVTGLRVIRSGRRNMLDEKGATVISMVSPIRTSGSNQVLLIDSTSSAINATASEYSEKWQTDKDEIRTYSSVYNPATCSSTLVPNCSGTLETAINPYRKGLLGVFRTFRNMVFYNNRTETNPTVATNLPKNGLLASFTPYWNFSGSGLAPNTTNALWVENIRTTRVNAQGLELETMNALGIYTAAQYGFNKTLPVAVVNNSPYYSMASEGFEDNNYSQSIDVTNTNPCPLRQIGFIGMPNSQLVYTDTASFAAHTGKYCLGVTHNNTASLSIPITAAPTISYNLAFGSSTTQVLNSPGINSSFVPAPGNSFYQTAPVTNTTSGVGTETDMFVYNLTFVRTTFTWDGYIQITSPGTYHFIIGASSNYPQGTSNTWEIDMGLSIVDANGNNFHQINGFTYLQNTTTMTIDSPFVLCPGIYHISTNGDNYFTAPSSTSNYSHDQYTFSCPQCSGPIYSGTTTSSGCTTTTGIPGSATMLNPTFSMPASVPMMMSAWVNENPAATSSGADTASTYNSEQIIVYDGTKNDTLLRAGPVIDGWQRFEGYFTPAASGTATINFVNNSAKTIYVDDIRLHPFNAEMKTYVYDPVSLRLVSELDANNYATFYEYDEEGTPVRTKAETSRGIQMIKETRSAKQKNITSFQ